MSEGSPAPPPAAGSSSEERCRPDNGPARKARLPRACTARSAARLRPESPVPERRRRPPEDAAAGGSGRVVTPLVGPPSPSQLPRWSLRSMWELASVLNFLHVFRPLLNIRIEVSAEELETALITPNSNLDDLHIPLLKAIPPVTRMALGRATWVTVLCRKLKDWWHWVANGEIPIVASHGAEIEAYKMLEPGTRVLILKAICDIRVEQEDIRSYIDNSLKHGIQLSAFRRERIGGGSHGISYWYEDDPILGHRLYREIRHVEAKKAEAKKGKKGMEAKGPQSPPVVSYQWETVATNLDEFQEVSDKLFSSKNRIEVALGKRLKIDILPEIEKIHKRKERVLKKQHRQALLLDSFITTDGLSSGRSLRDRKPVTYTFDDYDRSINEALKITKKRQASPEQVARKETIPKPETSVNGKWSDTSQAPRESSYDVESPKSTEYEETDEEHQAGPLDRSDRRRKRPERYSEKEFVEAVSDNEADFDSDDDIVGEAVYDEEYLRNRKQRKVSSSSEGDEEYRGEENAEEDDEEEGEEEEESLSVSEDDSDDDHRRYKKFPSRSRRGMTKLRSVDELQTGLRRSKRSTRPRINYQQYELSESDADYEKQDKSDPSDGVSDASDEMEISMTSSQRDEDETKDGKANGDCSGPMQKEPFGSVVGKAVIPGEEKVVVLEGTRRRRFLDLNELAPGTGFEDTTRDEDEES